MTDHVHSLLLEGGRRTQECPNPAFAVPTATPGGVKVPVDLSAPTKAAVGNVTKDVLSTSRMWGWKPVVRRGNVKRGNQKKYQLGL